MVSGDEMRSGLTGAWKLMMGKADGLRLLDLSVDGFWNSFFAIPVALPALLIGWVAFTNEVAPGAEFSTERLALLPRLAIIDLATWVAPLIGLALVVKPAGIGDRFTAYVVATNWGSVILVWLMLPASIFRMLMPASEETTLLVSLIFYVASLVLGWRLTNAAIDRGAAIATAVYVGVFLASLGLFLTLQTLLGIPSA